MGCFKLGIYKLCCCECDFREDCIYNCELKNIDNCEYYKDFEVNCVYKPKEVLKIEE